MIQIELSIPELLVRKLKALAALMDSPVDIEDLVMEIMDEAVSIRIAALLGLELKGDTLPHSLEKNAVKTQVPSTLDDGLGDEDESDPPPVESMFDLVPSGGGGLTDSALDEDMEIGDPDHEAKAEAFDIKDYGHPEAVFSKMVGLPVLDPADDNEIDDRILKRRKKLVIKGRVTPATEISEGY